MWYPGDIEIAWSPEKDNFTHANQFIFLALPWVLLFMIFLFRRQLKALSPKFKNYFYPSMGIFMILWELWFDVSSIVDSTLSRGDAVWDQFVGAFDFCRMNMYIIGSFLVFRRADLVKWATATALFGGYSTLIDHYHGSANIHSLVTHAIILSAVPALVVTMDGTNYKVRNLIHAHLFNWLLVIVMYSSNVLWDGVAGELTPQRMGDNVMVGWAPWPANMFLWILSVMVLEWAYFAIFRLVYWRTYQTSMTVKETFTNEWPEDKKEWYGFKMWGSDSYITRLNVRFNQQLENIKNIKNKIRK